MFVRFPLARSFVRLLLRKITKSQRQRIREKTNVRPVAASSTLHLCSRNEEIFLISVVDLKVFDCAFACRLPASQPAVRRPACFPAMLALLVLFILFQFRFLFLCVFLLCVFSYHYYWRLLGANTTNKYNNYPYTDAHTHTPHKHTPASDSKQTT